MGWGLDCCGLMGALLEWMPVGVILSSGVLLVSSLGYIE